MIHVITFLIQFSDSQALYLHCNVVFSLTAIVLKMSEEPGNDGCGNNYSLGFFSLWLPYVPVDNYLHFLLTFALHVLTKTTCISIS